MRIVQLKAENFKRLRAVQITPEGDLIQIGGDNGEGKSSVLDAIWVALAGKSVAPPKPIRAGEEMCTIELDLGEIKITRQFRDRGAKITDTVKVESAEGLRYSSPQEVLDGLIGAIGFDPLDFARRKPDAQAAMLLEIVPLPIDLEEFEQLDASDYAKRRDVNRDVDSLRQTLGGLPPARKDLPASPPDSNAIAAELGAAADKNAAINAERQRRENLTARYDEDRIQIEHLREQIARLTIEADTMEVSYKANIAAMEKWESLPDFVDTDQLRHQLAEANDLAQAIRDQNRRTEIEAQLATKEAESQRFTDAMNGRAKERREALTQAAMPIQGLQIALNEKGKPVVQFEGVPFEQISTAEQIRASTAIAMAANPELRVLRIKDGAMLDKRSMAIIGEMAQAEDFQLWVEVVGEGDGIGFIMEDGLCHEPGAAAQAPAEEPTQKEVKPKPKPKGKGDDAQGSLV